jgi:4-hydroxybenzoyl-CoA thioesterase
VAAGLEPLIMAPLVNRRNLRIEWGQCDPAGIVFYPQFFVMFDTSTGLLFARTGLSPSEMRSKYGIIGMPLVDTGVRFLLPCHFDEDIVIESFVETWGRTSFTVRHHLLKSGHLAVDGFEKRVWASADPERPGKIKPQPIPPEIIAALSIPAAKPV